MAPDHASEDPEIDVEVGPAFAELPSSTDDSRYGMPPAPGDFVKAIEWIRRVRSQDERPGEGLRERKKRLMAQAISDTATWMFCDRGYDEVRVADIAAAVGVSEKTVFNYFPTKESLVFDREQETTRALVEALRNRDPRISPVQVAVQLMRDDWLQFADLEAEALWMIQAFGELVRATPALQAAEQAMNARIVEQAAAALAENAQVDPLDPEPQIVAHALMGLWHVRVVSTSRHIGDGLTGAELAAATEGDVDRAARLAETGLWSFNLFTQGKRGIGNAREAARAFKDVQQQVHQAMHDARDAFRASRDVHADAMREARKEGRRGGPRRGGRGGRG